MSCNCETVKTETMIARVDAIIDRVGASRQVIIPLLQATVDFNLRKSQYDEYSAKSRRDGALLTAGFNLRTTDTAHIHPSPAWDDTLLSGVYIAYVDKLCVFASLREIIISRKVAKTQRLKYTDIDREKYMMQVPSLRDFCLF